LKSLFDVLTLVLLGLTFFAGAGVLITGNVINRRQAEQLRRFNSDLTAAETELGKQQERAREADERAGKIEASNITLRTDLENATAESTRRQTELEVEQRKTAEAQKALVDAQSVLKRHIEESAMPRRIIMGSFNGDGDLRQSRFKEVEKYSGTAAIIQPVPNDFEALTLAKDIQFALNKSKWNAVIVGEDASRIPAGYILPGVHLVTLENSPFKYDSPPKVEMVPVTSSESFHAANALANLLAMDLGPNESNPSLFGVLVERELDDEHTRVLTLHGFKFPPGAVVILVGIKPTSPWFGDIFWPQAKTEKKDK
jgi:hypothetical protein